MSYRRRTRIRDRRSIIFGCLMFVVVGLVFVSVGIGMGIKGADTDDGRIYTTAIISFIDSEWRDTSDGYEREYTSYVIYEVEGEQIETNLSTYSSDHHVGKEIEIYYYPDRPYTAYEKNSHIFFAIIFPIIGGIAVITGLAELISLRKNKDEFTSAEQSADYNTFDYNTSDHNASDYNTFDYNASDDNTSDDSTMDYPFVD